MSNSEEFITVSAHLTVGWMPSLAHTLIPEKRRERRSISLYLSLLCLESGWMWLQRTLKIIPRLNDSNPISRSADGSQHGKTRVNHNEENCINCWHVQILQRGWAARQCLLFWLMRHYILLFLQSHIYIWYHSIKFSQAIYVYNQVCKLVRFQLLHQYSPRLGTSHYDCGAATYANAHGKEPPVLFLGCGDWWDGMVWFLADAGLCVGPSKLLTIADGNKLKSAHWSVVKFGVMIQFKRTRFITWVGIFVSIISDSPNQNGPTCEILQFTQIQINHTTWFILMLWQFWDSSLQLKAD